MLRKTKNAIITAIKGIVSTALATLIVLIVMNVFGGGNPIQFEWEVFLASGLLFAWIIMRILSGFIFNILSRKWKITL